MKAEWWIDGPPERFERGMFVRLYWDWELVVILVQEDGAWVHPDEDHDVTFITLVDVTAHCPMMPRLEAEKIERFAFEQGALAGYSRCSAGLETWTNNDEWECYFNGPLRRERRAGDE